VSAIYTLDNRLQEEYLCGTNASKVREKTEAGKMMYVPRRSRTALAATGSQAIHWNWVRGSTMVYESLFCKHYDALNLAV
jgi:hypothetical protein